MNRLLSLFRMSTLLHFLFLALSSQILKRALLCCRVIRKLVWQRWDFDLHVSLLGQRSLDFRNHLRCELPPRFKPFKSFNAQLDLDHQLVDLLLQVLKLVIGVDVCAIWFYSQFPVFVHLDIPGADRADHPRRLQFQYSLLLALEVPESEDEQTRTHKGGISELRRVYEFPRPFAQLMF